VKVARPVRRAGQGNPPRRKAGRAPWPDPYTKLHGPAKWTSYYLYVILDINSRYAVGWMLPTHESAVLAEKLIADTAAKQGISRGQLTLHADRGSSMTSKPVAFLLADLGVTQSHSRPHVSNDNPFSEAQFKTLKYRPDFPKQFGSIEAARAHCQRFFTWYKTFIVMAAWDFTRPPTSTTDTQVPCVSNAPSSCPRPTRRTQNGSSASRQSRRRSPQTRGSTRPKRWRPSLSKSREPVPHPG